MDLIGGMKRQGFLDDESRRDLIELARDGSAAHRLAWRANALILLDKGMSYAAVAKVLLLDDDTIRTWRLLYEEDDRRATAGVPDEVVFQTKPQIAVDQLRAAVAAYGFLIGPRWNFTAARVLRFFARCACVNELLHNRRGFGPPDRENQV